MPTLRLALTALLALSVGPLAGCAVQNAEPEDGEDEEQAPELDGREAEAAAVGVDCSNRRSDTGYKSGSAFAITVVDADNKPVELATASAYARMQKAAAAAGVHIRVVSGFRTMSQQKYLYNCYVTKSCNGGNLAAKPGYSNHQSGHALDLNTSSAGVGSWLAAHADEYGFKRTVPSEPWHWEYWGSTVGGSCVSTVTGGGGGGGGSTSGCYSSTLGKQVVLNTCVQSRADSKWYQCIAGGKWEIRWDVPAKCVSEHPL
ncbi:MAG: M15 family metallopeptidase [Myxococcales bacterium]|nr:M15 family metallopeptidase [Myxococcales bacterium]